MISVGRVLSSSFLLLTVGLAGCAQNRSTEGALELARAVLIGFPFGGNEPPEFIVDRLSPEVTSLLELPPATRIMGSISYPRYSFSFLALPPGSAAKLEDWVGGLRRTGWIQDEAAAEPGFQMAGDRQSLRFCSGDSISVSIGAAEAPSGDTNVHIAYITDRRFVNCPPAPRLSDRPTSPIPSLSPPPGSVMLSGGGGGSSGEWHSSAGLDTDQTPALLLEHYVAQLRRAAWDVGEAETSSLLAVAPVSFRGQDARPWYGVITVAAPPTGTDRTVFIMVRQGGASR